VEDDYVAEPGPKGDLQLKLNEVKIIQEKEHREGARRQDQGSNYERTRARAGRFHIFTLAEVELIV
jgi:hypothetical protein